MVIHTNNSGVEVTTLRIGELTVDLRSRTVSCGGRRIDLTNREFGLLECLASHPGWVFSKERLLELVWGYDFGDARTVGVHLGNLRRKLGESAEAPRYVHTVKGVGYKLEVPAPAHFSSPPLASTRLVGRAEQIDYLVSAWESVCRERRGRAVLLTGEAGIGKTRLAQELALRVQETGTAALWGRSYEAEGKPAYLPWTKVMETYLRSEAGGFVISELGRHKGPLSRICPDVLLEGSAALPAAEESAAARYRLFDAVTAFLGLACSKSGPLLIVLDDLHDADAGSLALLEHLARDLASFPLLVLACYRREQTRDRELLTLALASLARGGLMRQLDLTGLDESRVAELLEAVGGRPAPATLAARVWDETHGNPFFVQELARLLVTQEAFETRGDALPELPDGVKATIGRRLALLRPTTLRLLEIASVAGREFSFALLDRVSDEAPASLLDSLAEATNAHIIERMHDSYRFRFLHNLFRQNLYSRLALPQRVRLHGEIGDALEELSVGAGGVRVEELAHHYLEASPVGWREKGLNYRLRAAREAMSRYAWENARLHFEQALALLSLASREVAEKAIRVEIWEGLGDARLVTEGYEQARLAYKEALEATSAEERVPRARLQRKIGRSYKEERRFAEAVQALDAAEEQLGPLTPTDNPTLWREWLEGRLEHFESSYYAAQGPSALAQLLDRIEPIMEKFGSPTQRTGFLRSRIPHCWARDGDVTSDECLAYLRAFVEAARAANLHAQVAFAEALLAAGLLMRPQVTQSDLVESERHGRLALDLGQEVGDIHSQMIALANLAINGRMRHNADLARHWGELCASTPRSGEWPDMAAHGVANLAWADWFSGDLEGARRRSQEALALWVFVPAMPHMWTARFPLLATELEEGHLELCLEQTRGLLDPLQRTLPDPLTQALNCSLVLAADGDHSGARAALERSVELARKYRFL